MALFDAFGQTNSLSSANMGQQQAMNSTINQLAQYQNTSFMQNLMMNNQERYGYPIGTSSTDAIAYAYLKQQAPMPETRQTLTNSDDRVDPLSMESKYARRLKKRYGMETYDRIKDTVIMRLRMEIERWHGDPLNRWDTVEAY